MFSIVLRMRSAAPRWMFFALCEKLPQVHRMKTLARDLLVGGHMKGKIGLEVKKFLNSLNPKP